MKRIMIIIVAMALLDIHTMKGQKPKTAIQFTILPVGTPLNATPPADTKKEKEELARTSPLASYAHLQSPKKPESPASQASSNDGLSTDIKKTPKPIEYIIPAGTVQKLAAQKQEDYLKDAIPKQLAELYPGLPSQFAAKILEFELERQREQKKKLVLPSHTDTIVIGQAITFDKDTQRMIEEFSACIPIIHNKKRLLEHLKKENPMRTEAELEASASATIEFTVKAEITKIIAKYDSTPIESEWMQKECDLFLRWYNKLSTSQDPLDRRLFDDNSPIQLKEEPVAVASCACTII